MECNRVRQLLPGYLDGALPSGAWSETHLMVGHHLEHCEECREELQEYLELSSLMSRVQRPAPPADLALRIRVAVAQRLADNPWLHYARLPRLFLPMLSRKRLPSILGKGSERST